MFITTATAGAKHASGCSCRFALVGRLHLRSASRQQFEKLALGCRVVRMGTHALAASRTAANWPWHHARLAQRMTFTACRCG